MGARVSDRGMSEQTVSESVNSAVTAAGSLQIHRLPTGRSAHNVDVNIFRNSSG